MKFRVREDVPNVPIEGPSRLSLFPSVDQAASYYRRSRLSNRRAVAREANRRGLLAGLVLSAGKPLDHAEAKVAAADSADGADPFGHCAVPDHWRPLFKRVFVKAAGRAAHTDRRVTVRA